MLHHFLQDEGKFSDEVLQKNANIMESKHAPKQRGGFKECGNNKTRTTSHKIRK